MCQNEPLPLAMTISDARQQRATDEYPKAITAGRSGRSRMCLSGRLVPNRAGVVGRHRRKTPKRFVPKHMHVHLALGRHFENL
jgi:hypothetical protein